MAICKISFKFDYDFSNKDHQAENQSQETWLAGIKARLRADNPSSVLVGEELQWPRADGYARYLVMKEKPLTLAHLAINDAYAVEGALIRGLRIGEARGMIEREKRLDALFKKGKKGK